MDGLERGDPDPTSNHRRRLTGASALRAHLTLLCGLALCGAAFWFELGRALRGNGLSWAYVFEWPLLGIFAVYMWWNVLNPERERARRSKTSTSRPELASEYQGMLTAWQEHQKELVETQERTDQELRKRDQTES